MTNRVINSKMDNTGYMKGDEIMTKKVTFGERDLELIKKIETYQKGRGLPSFIEAVRILCNKGLKFNELISENK